MVPKIRLGDTEFGSPSKRQPPMMEVSIHTGDVRLRCLEAGNPDHLLVVFLHGFPARAKTWKRILPAVADAGFHCIAPDQRGYGESSTPSKVADYSVVKLAADVAAIIGERKAHVVGHDFGGGVAWATAMLHPERVHTVSILNAVHPIGFEQAKKRWSQLKKSWYVFFFQLPWLPEWWLARNFRRLLEEDGVAADFIDDFAKPLHPRPAIDWYRASFRDGLRKRLKIAKVEHPALVVWGEAERHLERDLSIPPKDWVPNARTEYVQDASHWGHHDAPDRVTALILDHFQRSLDELPK